MKSKTGIFILLLFSAFILLISADKPPLHDVAASTNLKRYLYVGVPGIRDYLGYGGHGILVFDIDHRHRFLRRIASAGNPDASTVRRWIGFSIARAPSAWSIVRPRRFCWAVMCLRSVFNRARAWARS